MIEVAGKKLDGYAQLIQGKLWVHRQGETFVIDQQKQSRRRKSVEGKSSTTQIVSPMPGKITKILVETQQSVEIGQAVLVMEAMKMEYTLKSELSTSIEKILVKVGDQVQLGQLLVKLSEAHEAAGKAHKE
jgi:biotin carboxyl carrier protein